MTFSYTENQTFFQNMQQMVNCMNKQTKSLEIISDTLPTILENLSTQPNNNSNNVSDGIQTFDELYYHRMVMFAVIVSQNKHIAWKSKMHSDGTMYDGMFIVGLDTPMGQITYHDKLKYWDYFDCVEVFYAPQYDGHTSNDVCKRLLNMIGKNNE